MWPPRGSICCDSDDQTHADSPGASRVTASLREELATDVDGAFPALVDEYGSLVVTLAARLTDTVASEDITQEVFLRAYRALHAYTAERIHALELRPWIVTIARNLIRNEYRRRERKGTVVLDESIQAAGDIADTAVAVVESHDQVNEMLSSLSDPQREAVVLRHIVGLPMREVALTMACPIGTAKSHVSRGLKTLRTEVEAADNLTGTEQ